MGIPFSAPTRNYRDRSHKPELLVALSQFEALAGFRPAARTVEVMQALAPAVLEPFINLLSGPVRRRRPAGVVHDVDHLSPARSRQIGARGIDGAISYVRSGEQVFAAEAKAVLELGERYPGDAGVLASLLLNRVTLAPARGSTCPPAICTPTCKGWVSR